MATDPAAGGDRPRGRRGRPENRWPPAAAVVVAAASYALLPRALLPSDLPLPARFLVPGIEAALLVSLIVTNPRRLVRESRVSRIASIVLDSLVILTNLVALGLLIHTLRDPDADGFSLLVGGMQVWLTNVIGFGLLYWELDRGGPVARRVERRSDMQPADFRFSQDENDDAVVEVATGASENANWVPLFVDYLYVSLTDSSAFSPTDTMPLSSRAKLLMGVEATAALLISLLVIARAVGSLGA